MNYKSLCGNSLALISFFHVQCSCWSCYRWAAAMKTTESSLKVSRVEHTLDSTTLHSSQVVWTSQFDIMGDTKYSTSWRWWSQLPIEVCHTGGGWYEAAEVTWELRVAWAAGSLCCRTWGTSRTHSAARWCAQLYTRVLLLLPCFFNSESFLSIQHFH